MKRRVQPAALRAALCAITIAVALVACGDDPTEAAAPESAAQHKAAQSDAAAAATAGMVAGVPADERPGAAVELKFELKARPAVNEALQIEIALVPREESELLRASFLAPEGLAIATSGAPAEYKDVEAKSVYRHTLTVTPHEEGVFYVSAFVAMNMANGTKVRTFHIPVLVGAPRDASEAAQSGAATRGASDPTAPSPPPAKDAN